MITLKKICEWVKYDKKGALTIFASALLMSIINIFPPIIVKNIMDAIGQKQIVSLKFWLYIFGGVLILKTIWSNYINFGKYAKIQTNIMKFLYNKYNTSFVKIDNILFEEEGVGKIVSKISYGISSLNNSILIFIRDNIKKVFAITTSFVLIYLRNLVYFFDKYSFDAEFYLYFLYNSKKTTNLS